MQRAHTRLGRLSKIGALTMVAMLSFAMLTAPATAQRRTLSQTFGEFMLLGFGMQFAQNLLEDGGQRCRTIGERAQGAAQNAAAGATIGAVAGGLTGLLMGDGSVGTGAVGAVVGGIAGRTFLSRAMTSAGQAAGASMYDEDAVVATMREYNENFEFAACNILQGAAVVRQPLVDTYVAIAQRHCPFEPDLLASEAQTAQLIACANNVSAEARDVVSDIVAINRATCRSIQQLANAIVNEEADSAMRGVETNGPGGRSVMPFAGNFSLDGPVCADGTLREVWGGFVDRRMDVSASPNATR